MNEGEDYNEATLIAAGNFIGWPIKYTPLLELQKRAKYGDRKMQKFVENMGFVEKFFYAKNQLTCPYPKPERWDWGPFCDWPRPIGQQPKKRTIQPSDCTKATYKTLALAKESCIFPRNHLRPYQCRRCTFFHLTSKIP